MKKTKSEIIYEIIMISLAIISISFIWIDEASLQIIDRIIWGIFFLDVTIRFVRAENKWRYIKENPFDIIAIIPLDSIFRIARIARFFKIIRLISISSHFFGPVFKILNTNGLNRVLTVTFVLLFISAIPICLVEPSIQTYEDALWWAFVTATTVGYGDLSPVTPIGRVIAIILMIFGIGLIGMITGSIATFFIKSQKQYPPAIQYLSNEIERYEEWSTEDIERIKVMLDSFKSMKDTGKKYEQ